MWRLPAGANPPTDAHTGGVALDWGLMYNFSFTVFGGAVQDDRGLLGRFEGSGTVRVDTVVPAGGSGLIFFDDFESGDVTLWSTSSGLLP